MDKLASISSVVVDIGELCRTHDLIEEDLPKGLWEIMKTLRRCVSQRFYFVFSAVLYGPSELHEIESTLRECRKIRRILMRTDMLRKIKQYDSKLSHILQTFQVSCKSLNPPQFHTSAFFLITQEMELALDSRFALIIQDRKVWSWFVPSD